MLTRSRSVKASKAGSLRVAIYTRKSVSEGLDQEFNTLDAQREAVEHYVRSQQAQAWEALPEAYDDGGYTGANTDRPAFQRLLADIELGAVDIVAVYRIDRLSRSLMDFTRLIELFEQSGVALVSVTENFETSSPMGRMVLNMLATFAQFERESIAQRTRDKIGASRRRGMWTGGRPVLGYDIVDKRLVVNEDEAVSVRAIFKLYLDHGSLLSTARELASRGWQTKSWTNKAGAEVSGREFTKTSLHTLLTTPIYLGKIRAGDEIVDGQHDAIVEEECWQAVQAALQSNRGKGAKSKAGMSKSNALLQGLARCGVCGSTLSHTYTQRGSRRYGYYVCARVQKQGAAVCPGSRVAAGELESFVLDELRAVGRDPALLEATIAADRRAREQRRPELSAEVRRLQAEKTRLEQEQRNLVDAVAEGGPDARPLVRRLEDLGQTVSDTEVRHAAAQRELRALEGGAVDADELRTALQGLDPIWEELFPLERARVLRLLLDRVEFDAQREEVALTFRPGAPRGLAG